MDYDKTAIPDRYDRARVRSPEVIDLWMDAVAAQVADGGRLSTILDLGCGTGRFTGPLRARFGAQVLGLDPSAKMLGRARLKADVEAVEHILAEGEHLPVRNESVDLIFMSMVFHHFADPDSVVSECHRTLRKDGIVFLRAGTAESIPSYPVVPFFPTAVPIMEGLLAPAADICDIFISRGFRSLAVDRVEQEIASTHAIFVTQLEGRADSVLARLDDGDFEAGLEALRSHAAEVDPKPVSELIDFFSFMKTA